MRKRRIRFSSLIERYKTRLNEIVARPGFTGLEPGFAYNARMMLLLAEQPDVRKVANHLGRSIKHVQRIRARFAQLGLSGLHEAPALSKSMRRSTMRPVPAQPVLKPEFPAPGDETARVGSQVRTLP